MAGVCFYYEDSDTDVWSGKGFDAWNYAFKAAGDIDKIKLINRTEQRHTSPDVTMEFEVVSDLDSELYLPTWDSSVKVVYVACPWDRMDVSTDLWSFDHQIDWYCFGPASGWHQPVPNGVCVPQAGRGALHSVHIATVVMMHRYKVLQWQ